VLFRYNEDTAALARFGEGGEEMSDEITQQTLLPGVKDPNLWMVSAMSMGYAYCSSLSGEMSAWH